MELTDIAGYVQGFFALVGIASFWIAIKAIDWAIAQKYVSHTKCEKCRGEIYKTIATDHDLLQKVDGKMDLVLEHLNIHCKQ